jgi:predicted metal-dependent hydrolase
MPIFYDAPHLVRDSDPRQSAQSVSSAFHSSQPRHPPERLNTELVKNPKDLLEYIIVHEMAHLLEPTHGERFTALLNRH